MAHYLASDIAKNMVASFQAHRKPISNLKLQKLLYYAQAWYLVLYGKPLFAEKIEAWVHGPVVPEVFRTYKQYQWKPITEPVDKVALANVQQHLDEVIRVYGKFDAVDLERMTHQESPWRNARGALAPDEPSNRVITHEAMKKFYSARLNG